MVNFVWIGIKLEKALSAGADELDRYGREPSPMANSIAKDQLSAYGIKLDDLNLTQFMDFQDFDFKHDYVELMTSFGERYPVASGRIRAMGNQGGGMGRLTADDS